MVRINRTQHRGRQRRDRARQPDRYDEDRREHARPIVAIKSEGQQEAKAYD